MQYVQRKLQDLMITEPDAQKRKWILDGSKYLIKLIDCVTDGHFLYIIMDFVEGYEMNVHSSKFNSSSVPWSFSIWVKLVCGIFALHSCGVAHRDIR
jgi:serine/threonine protein kinase